MSLQNLSTLGVGASPCCDAESEYAMQVRKLEQAMSELDEGLAMLGNRLEPIRFYGPEKQADPRVEPPDAPMSPVCDFIRQSSKKINKMSHVVKDYLSQIQI